MLNDRSRIDYETYCYARCGRGFNDHGLKSGLQILAELQGCLRKMGDRSSIYAEQVIGSGLIFGLFQ